MISSPRIIHRPLAAAAFLVAVASIAGCSGEPGAGSASTPPAATASGPHGYVAGAEEAGEAQLSLALIDGAGAVTVRDLLTEESVPVDGSGTKTPNAAVEVVGDGRFVYVVHGGTENGADDTAEVTVQVVDTGVWTVDHEDHMHYYRAEPAVVGEITGPGAPAIESNDGHTAVLFAGSSKLALLSHAALGKGEIDTAWVDVDSHAGGFAVPFGGHLIVSDSAGAGAQVRALSMDGTPDGDALAACPSPQHAVVTRVGLVASCADGAVLVTESKGELVAEHVAYPAGIAAPAGALDGRAGRPSVAGIAGAADVAATPDEPATSTGAWRFDARARSWVFLPSDVPLVRVSAVADDLQLSVAIDEAGRVRVLDEAGAVIAQSEPLVAASLADEATRGTLRLVVDAQRAYVFGPAEGAVFEIDYRDAARVARTFDVGSGSPAAYMHLVG